MESRTKNRQPAATLRSMVERAYGAAACLPDDDFASELDHGWFNAVYRVRLRDSRDVVLKIAPSPRLKVLTYEHDLMRNEWAALEVLRAESLAVPAVEFADPSREICDADWFFMEFVEGENFGQLIEQGALSTVAAENLYEQLGELNRGVNKIVGPGFGSIAEPHWSSWRAAFTNLVEDVLRDGEAIVVDIGCSYRRVRKVLAAHSPVLEDVTEPRFVAWDLWPSNTMTSGGRITALIDPERAMWGDPLMEAGLLGPDLPIFGDRTAFGRGYRLGSLSPSEELRRRLYTMYLILVMIVEPGYRGTQDPHQVVWCRDRLADLLEGLESPASGQSSL
ncbi:MAG: aminoglycoside phosphotransferase family protein [Actinobacteria bacterium]|nr:aminoglycoside phosphotransferase family protein [Actinomycetota bacterium]